MCPNFCLPFEQESTLKGKNLFPSNRWANSVLLEKILFQNGLVVQESKYEVISLVVTTENIPSGFSPLKSRGTQSGNTALMRNANSECPKERVHPCSLTWTFSFRRHILDILFSSTHTGHSLFVDTYWTFSFRRHILHYPLILSVSGKRRPRSVFIRLPFQGGQSRGSQMVISQFFWYFLVDSRYVFNIFISYVFLLSVQYIWTWCDTLFSHHENTPI